MFRSVFAITLFLNLYALAYEDLYLNLFERETRRLKSDEHATHNATAHHSRGFLISFSKTAAQWTINFAAVNGTSLSDLDVAARRELVVNLHQVINVTRTLLQNPKGCDSGHEGGTGHSENNDDGGACHAAAPELLHGSTAAFLASLVQTFPHGPSGKEALGVWAISANAFLEQYQRMQRQAVVGAEPSADGSGSETEAESDDSEDGDHDGTGGRKRRSLADGGGPATGAAGVQYGGLPLVRRLLLAQLLLGWIESLHHDLPIASQTAMEDVLKMFTLLYEIHVDSVAQRGVMEYFHISKAGGTSWASAANLNHCVNARASTGKVREFDDECRWINGTLMRQIGVPVKRNSGLRQVCSRYDVIERMTPIQDCQARLKRARAKGLQYVANEYTLTGGLHDMYGTQICPQFVNVISIREPLSRLLSHLKYTILRLHAVLFNKNPVVAALFPMLFCAAPTSTWEKLAPPVADNYNIRTLVGELAFHTALYEIGEAHEALAKQLLAQYDLILDLGAGDIGSDLLMRWGLGWNITLAQVHAWSSDRLARQSGLSQDECPLGNLEAMLRRQVYDQRWYSFGRTLSQLDQLFLSAAVQLRLRPWPAGLRAGEGAGERVAQTLRGDTGGGSTSPSRCGLLGAVRGRPSSAA